ncbi:expressed unknown protein [Seminavis robusta]|uniref:Uncharacterized protein n=1 Tax=Seminavis robusta TaxID=568900 RepID=A0A9N8EAI0_9STRA|nr:expressed unknown protein [Seminavis robusta]CAB9530504.1 expressed unknown protein [Seminavis robusta]|eukprot:Sro2904_g339930.1 n/a (99) ;mRNA; f:9717-10013
MCITSRDTMIPPMIFIPSSCGGTFEVRTMPVLPEAEEFVDTRWDEGSASKKDCPACVYKNDRWACTAECNPLRLPTRKSCPPKDSAALPPRQPIRRRR